MPASPPLRSRLAPGAAAFHDLVVPVQAIALDNITVEGERRCVLRPEGGLDVARVWEEARKALAAAAFTDETSVYRYVTMKYERDLDTDARTVTNEQRNFSDLMQRQTFVSRPVEELMADGFVQEEEDGTYYYAPDANVMLSDAFLDTHCLRVRDGEDETAGLIGLAFEPVEGRRGHIDIRGVMVAGAGVLGTPVAGIQLRGSGRRSPFAACGRQGDVRGTPQRDLGGARVVHPHAPPRHAAQSLHQHPGTLPGGDPRDRRRGHAAS